MTSSPNLTFRYRFACLALVGIVFYSTYGLSNWVATQQHSLPEIFWQWERNIPFWAWTVIPYWTLNLCYAAAFFVCRDKAQLHHLIKQLLLAQAIATACFLLYPMNFSWAKPVTNGVSGTLFQILAGFDAPFNQAPSLHIMLTVIIGRFYWYRFPKFGQIIWLLWFILIGVSVLTTYQHHFIDIPTGLLVAFVVLYCFPRYQNTPVKQSFFRQPQNSHLLTPPLKTVTHKKWAFFYTMIALVFSLLGVWLSGAGLWLLWIACAYTFLAWVYCLADPARLQKQPDGHQALMVAWLMLPCKLATFLNIKFWLFHQPYTHRIINNIHVGSILSASKYQIVLDVCAEYPISQTPQNYQCIPMLDMVPMDNKALCMAAEKLHQLCADFPDQEILVCCALGYSRSVAVTMTYLMRFKAMQQDDALKLVRQKHPKCVLSGSVLSTIYEAVYGN